MTDLKCPWCGMNVEEKNVSIFCIQNGKPFFVKMCECQVCKEVFYI